MSFVECRQAYLRPPTAWRGLGLHLPLMRKATSQFTAFTPRGQRSSAGRWAGVARGWSCVCFCAERACLCISVRICVCYVHANIQLSLDPGLKALQEPALLAQCGPVPCDASFFCACAASSRIGSLNSCIPLSLSWPSACLSMSPCCLFHL